VPVSVVYLPHFSYIAPDGGAIGRPPEAIVAAAAAAATEIDAVIDCLIQSDRSTLGL
jgi:hypothetical protein